MDRDRYAVGRWLRGQSDVPLPEFLQLVEVCTVALIDFVAAMTSPDEIASLRDPFQRLVAARRAAAELPWSHAIVHMVDLPGYQGLPRHQPGWFASRLGISVADERASLELLVEMGRLRWCDDRYQSTEELAVDTRADPNTTRRLASFWMEEGARRVLTPDSWRFAFNTFALSKHDWTRLEQLQRSYFAELRSIVHDSRGTDLVAVATFQLCPLAGTFAEHN